MEEMSTRCPECNDESCQIAVGDTFTEAVFVFHMRCDICGHDYEASMKRAFKVRKPEIYMNDYSYRFQEFAHTLDGRSFASYLFINKQDDEEQWISSVAVKPWLWNLFLFRISYRARIEQKAIENMKERLTIEAEEKSNGNA